MYFFLLLIEKGRGFALTKATSTNNMKRVEMNLIPRKKK